MHACGHMHSPRRNTPDCPGLDFYCNPAGWDEIVFYVAVSG
jgi:hypothetical protein